LREHELPLTLPSPPVGERDEKWRTGREGERDEMRLATLGSTFESLSPVAGERAAVRAERRSREARAE